MQDPRYSLHGFIKGTFLLYNRDVVCFEPSCAILIIEVLVQPWLLAAHSSPDVVALVEENINDV